MEGIEQILDGVWHLGHPDPKAYGANSFLVRSPVGSVMVDVPSFADPVLRFLEEGGGVQWILLTHRDDVGDAPRFRERFGAEILIHAQDRPAVQGPARAFDGDFLLADKLRVLSTPGHSPGSACLLYEAHGGILFSGDHILFSKGSVLPVNLPWTFDWDLQLESVVKVLAYEWEVLLAGHGPWRTGLKGARAKLERSLSQIEAEKP